MTFYFFHNLQPISYLFVIWLKTIIVSNTGPGNWEAMNGIRSGQLFTVNLKAPGAPFYAKFQNSNSEEQSLFMAMYTGTFVFQEITFKVELGYI